VQIERRSVVRYTKQHTDRISHVINKHSYPAVVRYPSTLSWSLLPAHVYQLRYV